jgi:hypothetical protein
MTFDFGTLIAHAAKTRPLGAGTIIGSGTVSNRDADGGPGKPIAQAASAIRASPSSRTVETIRDGQRRDAVPARRRHGPHRGPRTTGHPIFGVIEQTVMPDGSVVPDTPCRPRGDLQGHVRSYLVGQEESSSARNTDRLSTLRAPHDEPGVQRSAAAYPRAAVDPCRRAHPARRRRRWRPHWSRRWSTRLLDQMAEQKGRDRPDRGFRRGDPGRSDRQPARRAARRARAVARLVAGHPRRAGAGADAGADGRAATRAVTRVRRLSRNRWWRERQPAGPATPST